MRVIIATVHINVAAVAAAAIVVIKQPRWARRGATRVSTRMAASTVSNNDAHVPVHQQHPSSHYHYHRVHPPPSHHLCQVCVPTNVRPIVRVPPYPMAAVDAPRNQWRMTAGTPSPSNRSVGVAATQTERTASQVYHGHSDDTYAVAAVTVVSRSHSDQRIADDRDRVVCVRRMTFLMVRMWPY